MKSDKITVVQENTTMRELCEKSLMKLICNENDLLPGGKLRRLNPSRGKSPAPPNHPWRQYKLTVKRQGQ